MMQPGKASDQGPGKLTDAVSNVLPAYEIPDDDLVGQVLIPAMRTAEEVRIGAGFFSSQCLAQIAPGLAAFVSRSSQSLRLLVSPEINDTDRQAIEKGLKSSDQVIAEALARLFKDAVLSESAIVNHTLDCLSYLVASRRLELRFVLMQRGMYHKKMWLFRSGRDWLAVHGSGNATARGLLVNGEQMTIDRTWKDGDWSATRVRRFVAQWDRQWTNDHAHSITLDALQGLAFAKRYRDDDAVPTVRDFWLAWKRDHDAGLEPSLPPSMNLPASHLLVIPRGLQWRVGPYAHQGRAVDRFVEAGGRGVLAIATGGGKTKTALIAATERQDRQDKAMLLVVLVPSRPLMSQWADEIRAFGLEPFQPSQDRPVERRARLEELRAAFATGERRTEVIIATNALFAEDMGLRSFVDGLQPGIPSMLIGDEVHNLGVPSFLDNLPERFDFRLGLSATPIRQYDPDGTHQLFSFFGPQLDNFELDDAIRAGCLTPYNYFLHEVQLNALEMDKYAELTQELRAAGFRVDDSGATVNLSPRVERLLRERRAILEQAEAKISALRQLLIHRGPSTIRRTLIYTSAKPLVLGSTRQIELVNALLSQLGIVSHQFTSAETPRPEASDILERFGNGDYQVLTAMKVLDEGIDIPQTDTAYILASSTVRREWVQRRGRILRRAPGKQCATVHDFLVCPPDAQTTDGRAILKGELARADEFAKSCANEWASDGPRVTIAKYEERIYSRGTE